MGMFEDARFAEGTFAVARAVAEATARERRQKHHRRRRQRQGPEPGELGRQGDFYEHGRRGEPRIFGRPSPARRGGAVGQMISNRNDIMNKERKLIIAGNWKMNKTVAEALGLVTGLKIELANVKEVDIVICPPFTALGEVSKAILDTNIRLGAQNMSEHNFGAFTGEIAAGMLKEFSVRYVILGHSERRQYQKESDALDRQKGPGRPRRLAQAHRLRRRNARRTRSRARRKRSSTPRCTAASRA